MKIGQQSLVLKEGQSAFNDIKCQTRSLYTGKPWFPTLYVMYYQYIDSLNI